MMHRLVILLVCFVCVFPAVAKERYLIFAAASMRDAMREIAAEFNKDTGDMLILSFAGTSILARQIDRGAPADIFISADEQWMNWLLQRNQIVQDSQLFVAGNRLVIAVRRETENWADPIAMLSKGLAAMANPETVPAGRYAKQALTKLGIWSKVSKNAVRTENVRLALALVARGEVEAAIVYASDVAAEPDVRSAFVFDEKAHFRIRYPAAILKNAREGSQKVLNYLTSEKARAILNKHGFQPAPN